MAPGRRGAYARGHEQQHGTGGSMASGKEGGRRRGPPVAERMAGVIGPARRPGRLRPLGRALRGDVAGARRRSGGRQPRGRRRRTSRPGRETRQVDRPPCSRDHDDGAASAEPWNRRHDICSNGRSGQLRRYPNLLIRRRPALPEDAHRGDRSPVTRMGAGHTAGEALLIFYGYACNTLLEEKWRWDRQV